MRVDQHACQRAVNTAVTGLLVQALVAAVLLVFGLVADDTPLVLASFYASIGLVAWLGLAILYYQQKMERLEALEAEELGGDASSAMFDTDDDDRPAARRLRMIHRWLMPAVSLAVAVALTVVALLVLRFLGRLDHPDDNVRTLMQMTSLTGWALAITLGFTLLAFIYSRFVAGMARVAAWKNLRGGASWMVGSAVLSLALSIGLVFRFFDNDAVIEIICWAIPIFMLAVAFEILLNFILNLYRPRIPGEFPRPAYDSKTLSMLAAPDSIVRSLNEAINYQFGFDIASSWGYQLLLRSFGGLLALAVAALLLLDTMVVVEPTQQAVRLRQGAIIGDVHGPGLMWKLPWPIESAEIVDVTRVRQLPLTFSWKQDRAVVLWSDDLSSLAIEKPLPFIVNGVADTLALVDLQAVLHYRVSDQGLLQWLDFAADDVERRSRLSGRELALRSISREMLTDVLQEISLEHLLGAGRGDLSATLVGELQQVLDRRDVGVKVVSVDVLFLRPAGGGNTGKYEELNVARQGRDRLVAAAQGWGENILLREVGDGDLVDTVVDAVDRYEQARANWEILRREGADTGEADEVMKHWQAKATALLQEGRGVASLRLAQAGSDRWVEIMSTWARASRVRGQMMAYAAAPNLYRQRSVMGVLARKLPTMRKYVVGIEPSRFDVDLELRTVNPLLNFGDTIEDTEGGSGP